MLLEQIYKVFLLYDTERINSFITTDYTDCMERIYSYRRVCGWNFCLILCERAFYPEFDDFMSK